MAIDLISGDLTMLELAKRIDPDGRLAKIAELGTKKNEIMQDLVWVPANGRDTHQFTQRLTEPTGTWGRINKGVGYESSRTRQVTSNLKMLEAFSRIDERLLNRFPDKRAARMKEDIAFIAGMTKEVITKLFYGNELLTVDEPHGLSNREYWDGAADANVTDSGGGGTLTSVWIIKHSSDDGLFMFYPEGDPTKMVESEDMGLQLVEDGSGNPYRAYVTYHRINLGFDIKDPRAVQRICNVETATGDGDYDTTKLQMDDLIDALMQMYDTEGAVIYMNKTVFAQLAKTAKDKTNVHYNPDAPFAKWQRDFMGTPVRLVEQIVNGEDAVA